MSTYQVLFSRLMFIIFTSPSMMEETQEMYIVGTYVLK